MSSWPIHGSRRPPLHLLNNPPALHPTLTTTLQWTRHSLPPFVPGTAKVDHPVSVLSRKLSMSPTLCTEWKRRVLEDEHTMGLAELEPGASCRVSTRKTKRPTRRLNSKKLGGSTERRLPGRFRNPELALLPMPKPVSKKLRLPITSDEEEPIDVRRRRSYTTVERVSVTEEKAAKVETPLTLISIMPLYSVDEAKRSRRVHYRSHRLRHSKEKKSMIHERRE